MANDNDVLLPRVSLGNELVSSISKEEKLIFFKVRRWQDAISQHEFHRDSYGQAQLHGTDLIEKVKIIYYL